MAKRDFYDSGFRRKPVVRRTVLGMAGDTVMLILTILFAILLICAYFARKVSPEEVWLFAFAGLIAPILYVLNIITALYWIIRWRLYLLIPVATILAGIAHIPLFFNPVFTRDYASDEPEALTVMSYNVMGFLSKDSRGEYESSLDSMSAFIRSFSPDILCIQEFQSVSAKQKQRIDSLLGMEYNSVHYSRPNKNGGGWGIAIYSDYPIVHSGSVDFEGTNNSSMWADMIIRPDDTMRVFSCHLQSTMITRDDRSYIETQEFLSDNTAGREEKMRGMVSKLKRNFIARASQADSIAPIIASTSYKTIVCGDFNDTPMSYTYTKMRGGLYDAFEERGKGVGNNTFKGLFNIFRIDYILHSPEFTTLSYSTPAAEYSDHKSVVAKFSVQEP